MNFDDDNEMWKHSEIMRNFVDSYLNRLEPAVDNAIVEASIEDDDLFDLPLVEYDQMNLIDIRARAESLIANLNKVAQMASKYNNEKVSYAIEQAIAEIKIISGLDQE